MRILTRYILKELFYHFFIIIGIATVILLAKEMYDARSQIVEEEPAFLDIVEYVVLSVPRTLCDIIPLISMFAVLFSLGFMAKNREIIAMAGTGISFYSLAFPVLIYGVLVMVGSFLFADRIAPLAEERAKYIFEIQIKGGNQFAYTSNDEIFRKGSGNRFYIMANFNAAEKTMTRPSILDRSPSGKDLVQRIEAESARLVNSPEGGKRYWEFEGAQRWRFNEDGTVKVEKFDTPLQIEMEEKLDSFLSREKSPRQMKLSELRQYCDLLKRQGAKFLLPKYQTNVQSKLALPVACLLLALLAFAVAVDLTNRHFVWVFSFGLGIGMGFYILWETLTGMGASGSLEPLTGLAAPYVAAWSPLLLFSILAAALFRRLTTVH